MMNIRNLKQSFAAYFNSKLKSLSARRDGVNLIGEHTDYNDGFVLPMAIDRAVWLALRPRADKTVRLFSLDIPTPTNASLQADSVFELNALTKGSGWLNIQKVLHINYRKQAMNLNGFDAIITGNVPRGAAYLPLRRWNWQLHVHLPPSPVLRGMRQGWQRSHKRPRMNGSGLIAASWIKWRVQSARKAMLYFWIAVR